MREPTTRTPEPEELHPALDQTFEPVALRGEGRLDKVVFGVAAAVALAFVAWGVISTDSLSTASTEALGWTVHNTGWLFVLVASAFVVFVIWLAVGKYGRIPLGRDDEEPEFRTSSWIAMMFSAGMGIGLVFWGVAEPLAHLVTPPPGTGEPGNDAAVQTAMATTLFHWTLHPWAIYAVVGLAVAYGVYRRGRSQLISSAFAPLIGERRANGGAGQVIDVLAIFATLFGSAASLGLGALQIASGLEIVSGIGEVGNGLLVGIIALLTVGFVVSAVSGVARGIQWLSNINMVLAVALALFVFVAGPTVFVLDLVPTAIGSYFQDLAMMSARTEAAGGEGMAAWLSGWTVFYWAWWLSWTPFVGVFIARISRGRTIRQFVTGVLLVPSLVSLVWFAIFGGSAIRMQQDGRDMGDPAAPESQLFAMLEHLPWTGITSVVVMVLVAIFFVSGADAASVVMGSLSQRGNLHPGRGPVIFWGVATGAASAVMLLVGGDDALTGLQNITIVAALPFALVMVGIAWGLVRDLQSDPIVVRRKYAVQAVENAVVAGVTQHGDDFSLTVEPTEPGQGVGPVDSSSDSSATSTGAETDGTSPDGRSSERAVSDQA
nr:BCCT family transporter [Nocardioides caldifontis]